jgi:putative oxidoreductase
VLVSWRAQHVESLRPDLPNLALPGAKSSSKPIDAVYGFDGGTAFLSGVRPAFTAATEGQEILMPYIAHLEQGRTLARRIPFSALALASRLSIAAIFWRSGQTKVSGFALREETFVLFREEYKVPLLPPEVAAYLATTAEHLFAILLVLGFATRLSALGLLGMTAVIQLFVYPGAWPEHALWTSLLLWIVARGPGAVSLDHLIWTRSVPVPALAR